MKNIPAVILAAGQSSRFWPLNSQHKSLIKLMGRPLIWYTLESLKKAGFKNIIIIQGAGRDVELALKDYPFSAAQIKYVPQKQPKGMGDALWQARSLLKGPFFVLNAERVDSGDIISAIKTQNHRPFYGPVLVGQKTQTPELYGIMRLQGMRFLGVAEKPLKNKAPSDVKIVGIYLLKPDFFRFYSKTKKAMYDFEDTLTLYAKAREVRVAMLNKKEENTPSLKYPWHLFGMTEYILKKFLDSYVAKTASVARNAVIKGRVHIGKNTKIFENAVISGPCYIGDNCVVGNNALVREYTNLENGSIVGANAEAARTIFQENVHCHSGFFGDSVFDKNCRIGAGAITANVRFGREEVAVNIKSARVKTGLTSLGAIVGANTHIGVNASLMPGVLVGSNSIVGPGSLVNEVVPNDTIFYSQFKNHQKKRR